jgi:hypothetical protein
MIGKLVMWLILAAVLISAGNAIVRKAFNIGSNAFLEIQWYLFAAVFMLGVGYVMLQERPCAHRLHLVAAVQAHQRDHRRHRHRGLHDPAVDHHDRPGLAAVHARLDLGEMSQNAGGLIRWPVLLLVPLGLPSCWCRRVRTDQAHRLPDRAPAEPFQRRAREVDRGELAEELAAEAATATKLPPKAN